MMRRMDKQVGPALRRLQQSAGRYGAFQAPHGGGPYAANTAAFFFRPVHRLGRKIVDAKIFCIHFMLGEVLYFDGPKSSKSSMQGNLGKMDPGDFQTLDELPAEMQARSWRRNGSFVL